MNVARIGGALERRSHGGRVNKWRGAVVVAALIFVGATAAWTSSANFAAADGFTGRNGFDCTSCHVDPLPMVEDAEAFLDGVPDAWMPGTTYPMTIRIEGGPPAAPAPQPQGGFEIESSDGYFSPGPGFADLVRFSPTGSLTYKPAGTLMRSWDVVWNAPSLADLAREPDTIGIWLAVVSASGNHVIATNTSDQGEKFDSVATLHVTIPVAAETISMWRDFPLATPVVADVKRVGPYIEVSGYHADDHATTLAWKSGDAQWQSRDTSVSWRLRMNPQDVGSRLEIRSVGENRTSPSYLVWDDDGVLSGDVSRPDDGSMDRLVGDKDMPGGSFFGVATIMLVAVVGSRSTNGGRRLSIDGCRLAAVARVQRGSFP